MIELALLYRILRFADRALDALRGVVAFPAALLDFVLHGFAPADHAAALGATGSGSSIDARVLRVRRRVHPCAPVEPASGEDAPPPARQAA